MLNKDATEIIDEVAVVTAVNDANGTDDDCIVLDLKNEAKPWRTRRTIHAVFGSHYWELKDSFAWNGADIPWVWQFMLGISRYDPRVALASGFHDDMCNQHKSANVQRVLGDAIFISLLMPIRFNGVLLPGVGPWRATAMYLGVRAYSSTRFLAAQIGRVKSLIFSAGMVLATILPPQCFAAFPHGTVLASKNSDEALNTSPGNLNHLAIVVSDADVIESQAEPVEGGKVGVIRTPLSAYMARKYTPILAFEPLDSEVGKRAAVVAEKLVGLPNRKLSSIFRRHGERRNQRGLNCVSVIEVAYAEDVPKIRRLKTPDDILKVKETFEAAQTVRP